MASRSKGGTGSSQGIIIFDIENVPQEEAEKQVEIDLVHELIMAKDTRVESTITSILLKPALEYCIPIISALPRVVITHQDIEKHSQIKASKLTTDLGVSILLEHDIDCTYNGQSVKVVSGQMINVTGLKIPEKIMSNSRLYVFDYLATDSKYKVANILRTGLYGVYNCYKNYFFSAFLNNTFHIGKKLSLVFDKNTEDNNSKIKTFVEFCQAMNSQYSSVYHLALSAVSHNPAARQLSLSTETETKSKSESQDISEWLISNKFADAETIKYIKYNVVLTQLIDKIQWFNSITDTRCKKYVEQLKLLIYSFKEDMKNKKSTIDSDIEVASKRIIAYSKFGTSNIHNLTSAQRKNIAQEYEAHKIKHASVQLVPAVQDLQNAIDQADVKTIQKSIDDIFELVSKDNRQKFEKQIKEPELSLTSLIKLDMSAISKKESANSKPQSEYISEICPHLLEYAIKMRDGGYIADIDNAIANKYGAQASTTQAKREQRDTYCKLCGALLAEYDEEDIAYKERDNYIMSVEDDEIFGMIKRELQFIFSYHMYLPQDSPIKQFEKVGLLDMLSSLIRIKILEIQSDLIKIKTLADNDMWVLINIYIYIYIFAILTQFVFANPSILQFRHAKVLIDNKRTNPSAESTTVGSGKTKRKSNNILGAKQVNITKSSKDILTDLLKRKESKESLEKLSNHALELIKKIKFAEISNSKYITMANIRELFLAAYKWTMTLNYNVESVADMVGKTESELKQTDVSNYNIIKYYELYGKIGRSYEKIESDFKESISVCATCEVGKTAPKEAVLLTEYIVGEKYKLKPIPSSDALDKIIEEFKDERQNEIKQNKPYIITKLRPNIKLPKYDLREAKLDLPYELVGTCEKSCNKTYVYTSGKSKYVEYSRKEIIEWLDTKNTAKLKELYALTCLGAKCICKDTKNRQIVQFYKYYEQFCPVGEIHEYSEKKCKKCGITEEILKSYDSAYFTKYKAEYSKQKEKEMARINKEIMQQVDAERRIIKEFIKQEKQYIEKFGEWKISTKEVTELAKIVSIKNLENLFLNIGLYEGYEYKLLETNKIQPYRDADVDVYRNQVNAVHNYILYVYRNYYTIKNSEYMIKLPIDIKTILTKSRQSNKDLAKKLTDLETTYIEKYDWYNAHNLEPKLFANFCITTLAQLFLTIYDIFKKAKLEPLGIIWIQFYLAKIIGYEKYMCIVKLKNLKPLARFQDEENAEDSKFEDNDVVNSKANSENPSIDDDQMEIGNEFANDDVDIEHDDDEDNMDNTFIAVD